MIITIRLTVLVLAGLTAASVASATGNFLRQGIGKIAKKVGAIPKCQTCKGGPQSTIINNIHVTNGGKVDARAILGGASKHGYSDAEGGDSSAHLDIASHGSGHVSTVQNFGGDSLVKGYNQGHHDAHMLNELAHTAGHAGHSAAHHAAHYGGQYFDAGHSAMQAARQDYGAHKSGHEHAHSGPFQGHAEGHGNHDVAVSVASHGNQNKHQQHGLGYDRPVMHATEYHGGHSSGHMGLEHAHSSGHLGLEHTHSSGHLGTEHTPFEGHAEGHGNHDVAVSVSSHGKQNEHQRHAGHSVMQAAGHMGAHLEHKVEGVLGELANSVEHAGHSVVDAAGHAGHAGHSAAHQAAHYGGQYFDAGHSAMQAARRDYGGHTSGHEHAHSGPFQGHAEGYGNRDVSASVASHGHEASHSYHPHEHYGDREYANGLQQQYNQAYSNEYAPQNSHEQWVQMSPYEQQAFEENLYPARDQYNKHHGRRSHGLLMKALGKNKNKYDGYEHQQHHDHSSATCGYKKPSMINSLVNRAINRHL